MVGHCHFPRLLEIVRGQATDAGAIATSLDLAKRLRKTGVLSGNTPGFLSGRLMDALRREATLLLEEGNSLEAVESALVSWGIPIDSLTIGILSELNTGWGPRGKWRDDRAGNTAGADRHDEVRNAHLSANVTAMSRQLPAERGIAQRIATSKEIVDRSISALAREGDALLAEGIALRASDIDLVCVHGYGFPSWRGGPMWSDAHPES
jgi:3-hydroxyacyl-CoA dehydrogenase